MSLWMCSACHSLQGFSSDMKCFACEGALTFAVVRDLATPEVGGEGVRAHDPSQASPAIAQYQAIGVRPSVPNGGDFGTSQTDAVLGDRRPLAPRLGDWRICQLDGCNIWRVERYQRARWPWWMFVEPEWRPVYLESLWMDSCRPAEYDTHMAAVAAVEKFEAQDRAVAARQTKRWRVMGRS